MESGSVHSAAAPIGKVDLWLMANGNQSSIWMSIVQCLPHKSSLRCRKCRLPCKSTLRHWKCHACHAKCRGANLTQFVAKLPGTSLKVQKVPHLPHKSSLHCRKCHACHANRPWGAESATLVTQKNPQRQSDPVRRQASADIYEGPESATAAT